MNNSMYVKNDIYCIQFFMFLDGLHQNAIDLLLLFQNLNFKTIPLLIPIHTQN